MCRLNTFDTNVRLCRNVQPSPVQSPSTSPAVLLILSSHAPSPIFLTPRLSMSSISPVDPTLHFCLQRHSTVSDTFTALFNDAQRKHAQDIFLSTKRPRPALGPTHYPSERVPVFYRGQNGPPSTSEVMNMWRYASTTPYICL